VECCTAIASVLAIKSKSLNNCARARLDLEEGKKGQQHEITFKTIEHQMDKPLNTQWNKQWNKQWK
jgi:hypothetical protein